MTAPDLRQWADFSGALRAILDEYARAIRDYEAVLLALPADRYLAQTALTDKQFTNSRDIARHVVGAAHSYADHINRALDKGDWPIPKHEFPVDTPQQAAASLWDAFGHLVEVLSRIKGWTDEQQEAVRFVSRWGQPYDIEQMLEHAIVHILRHRRQLERWRDAPMT